jgi:CheY-like chemotaxis protein
MLAGDAQRVLSPVLDWPHISVLVVDRDPAVGAAVVTMLRIMGVGIVEFATSREGALGACSEQHFDVALVDLQFDAADRGVALAASLRAASRDVAVVFMSGSRRPSTLAEAAVFLPKPFATGNLRAAMLCALSA